MIVCDWVVDTTSRWAKQYLFPDGAVLSRTLGIFLNFLQSEKGGVFVYAPTNDIAVLHQEIMRAGCFDALFFVGHPNA